MTAALLTADRDRVASTLHLMHHALHHTARHSGADAIDDLTRQLHALAQLLEVVLPLDECYDDLQLALPDLDDVCEDSATCARHDCAWFDGRCANATRVEDDDDDTDTCDECDATVPSTGVKANAHHYPTCSLHTCDAACDHVDPRERGDDDGVEYADPRDAKDGVE